MLQREKREKQEKEKEKERKMTDQIGGQMVNELSVNKMAGAATTTTTSDG